MLVFYETLNDVPIPISSPDEDLKQEILHAKTVRLLAGENVIAIVNNPYIVEENENYKLKAKLMQLQDT